MTHESFYSDILGLNVMEKPTGIMENNGTYPISPREYLKALKKREVDTPCLEIEDAERALSIGFDDLPHYKSLTK